MTILQSIISLVYGIFQWCKACYNQPFGIRTIVRNLVVESTLFSIHLANNEGRVDSSTKLSAYLRVRVYTDLIPNAQKIILIVHL